MFMKIRFPNTYSTNILKNGRPSAIGAMHAVKLPIIKLDLVNLAGNLVKFTYLVIHVTGFRNLHDSRTHVP